jgi:hypothetical protein
MMKSLPYFFGALVLFMMLAALTLGIFDHGWVLKGHIISIIAVGFVWLCLLNGIWIFLMLGTMEVCAWFRARNGQKGK